MVLVVGVTACGDDGGGGASAPGPAAGDFVRVTGFLNETFSIDPKKVAVKCTPKPTPKIFEFSAGTPGAGAGLAITFNDYQGGKDHPNLAYDPAGPQHDIRVTLAGPDKGYTFVWNQSFRADTQEDLPSLCDFSLKREETASGEHFSGTLVCSMLWAEANSDGFDPSAMVNNFVDLFARFECDRAL